MKCKCQSLPNFFYLDDFQLPIANQFKLIDGKDWKRLYICTECNTHWVIDEWDKYSFQVAVKIDSSENWNENQFLTERKSLLLTSRNGLGNSKCLWVDCNETQVKGSAYCIDHLWNTGARK